MHALRIGIVGGSISGCAAAIELGRDGHAISVYERHRGALTGRGAGIGTPITTFRSLTERGTIPSGIPHFLAHRQPFVSRSSENLRLGHTAWASPITLALINWGDLYGGLRSLVPDADYHSGCVVSAVREHGDGAELVFEDASERSFDLVLFADGYQSLGRRTLFPECEPEYCGYVLWRGVLEESLLSDSGPLDGNLPRINYGAIPGHVVMYFVPGKDGSVTPGKRWVNWAAYVPVTEAELPAFLVDRHGQHHETSLPPGSMRPEEERRLKGLMNDFLPTYYADIIAASENTFAQPIYLVEVPAYHRGRVALLGDAGALAQPFTGSGVFKGTTNATELAGAIRGHLDLDAALRDWGEAQTRVGQRLAALGRQMEKAFVWDAPDFSTMDEASAAAWWQAAVTFPDEFSYGLTEDV